MIPGNMRPPVPPEVALWAYVDEHRRCGELDGGVEDGWLRMECDCGARIAKALKEGDR
jgi:hypothetical protein